MPLVPPISEHLDLYPAPGLEHPAPVLVYSHGGYWWSQTSKVFGFVARGPASRGVATAAVNYALRPEVTIDEIVRRVRAAVVGTYGNAKGFGDDSEHIRVAGDSAPIRRLLRGLE